MGGKLGKYELLLKTLKKGEVFELLTRLKRCEQKRDNMLKAINNPNLSLRKLGSELGLSYGTVRNYRKEWKDFEDGDYDGLIDDLNKLLKEEE